MRIIKTALISALLIIPTISFADNCESEILDKITYDISSEKNIESKDAKVSIQLNATLKSEELNSIQNDSKDKLVEITKSNNWKIDNYSQTKTNSGLVNVYISFTNRLNSIEISDLTTKIESLNTSGNNFKIQNIDYNPSLAQRENTENELRLEILSTITKQVKDLNNNLDDKYSIHKVSFYTNSNNSNKPMLMAVRMNDSNEASSYQENMNVSTDVSLRANIELAKENGFSCSN